MYAYRPSEFRSTILSSSEILETVSISKIRSVLETLPGLIARTVWPSPPKAECNRRELEPMTAECFLAKARAKPGVVRRKAVFNIFVDAVGVQ